MQYLHILFDIPANSIIFACNKPINPKNMLGTQEIFIIALIILLLFGGKKIPELMKGLGKGVKSFKDGVNGIENEANPNTKDTEKDTTTNANDK